MIDFNLQNIQKKRTCQIFYIAKKGEFSIDVSEVKESFTWFINMADFIKTTELKCKDCDLYPGCGRYPKSEQRIGFCFEKKKMRKRGYCFDCKHEIEVDHISESCPFCGSDNWNVPPKQMKR